MDKETGSVPKWFSDFMVEFGKFREQNQREHGQLLEKIQASENRMIRWTIGAIGVGVTIILVN